MKSFALVYCCIIFNMNGFTQALRQSPVPRDWLEKDPVKDSVAGISLDKAYLLLKGKKSKTVIVAVIDNGVDIEHEDLKRVIWTNTREIPGNGIDDDHNGYTDDVHGWNFRGAADGAVIENEQSAATQMVAAWQQQFENAGNSKLTPAAKKSLAIYLRAKDEYIRKLNSKDVADTLFAYNINYHSDKLIAGHFAGIRDRYYGSPLVKLSANLTHGTHVAGIIAAIRNNGIGMNGIADNVLIMPIVATTAVGDERDKDVANAIRYATDNGAQIISMSFSKTFSADKAMVDEAIVYAEAHHVLVVHCAGNDGVNIDSSYNYHYPVAEYENGNRAGNFITVGWNRPLFDYRLAHPYSNYGKMNVDLFAPGSDIYSTVPGNGYDLKSGSSMSAPVVTGVAALLMSYFPQLSIQQVKAILIQSAYRPEQLVNRPQTKTPVPFNSLSASGGIVNAYRAVQLAIKIVTQKK